MERRSRLTWVGRTLTLEMTRHASPTDKAAAQKRAKTVKPFRSLALRTRRHSVVFTVVDSLRRNVLMTCT